MTIYKNKKGFTLIELLVVIAIIGILASVVLSALNSARLKGRNAQRVSQLRQIKIALEMYYDDHNAYPNNFTSWHSDCANLNVADVNLMPGLIPTYLPALLHDSTRDYANSKSCLYYRSNGTDYMMGYFDIQDPSSGFATFNYTSHPELLAPNWDGTPNCLLDNTNYRAWVVYTDGARCW